MAHPWKTLVLAHDAPDMPLMWLSSVKLLTTSIIVGVRIA